MSRRTGIALAAIAACCALATPAQAAKPAPYVVDDNKAECPNAQYTTIQQAVLVAPAGATIQVCPGTYTGPVALAKPVTLLGARNGNAAAPGRDDPAKESTIVNNGTGGVYVTADDVTIDGFTIQGASISDASYPGAGIDLAAGARRTITDDIIRGNGLGLHVNGSQTGLTVARNAFTGNVRTTNPAFIPTGAIFQDAGSINDSSIDHNLFTGNEQFGINIGSGSDRGLSIDHNTARDDDTFLVIGRTTGAVVAQNSGQRLTGNFVYAFGDNVRMSIDHNDAAGAPANASGIVFDTPQYGTTNADRDETVTHNSVTGFTRAIRINSGTGFLVSDNKASNNSVTGILLDAVTNGLVAKNQTDDNAQFGIRATDQASGNTIDANHATGNGTFDCDDESVGTGTGGTANTWTRDHGDTQNRPGLCK